jgi:adenylosuccinate lyase
MPHKVNPIDFENAEGNLGIANACSRTWLGQAAGVALAARSQRLHGAAQSGRRPGHSLLACAIPVAKGLGKLEVRRGAHGGDLDASWEVLAEQIQTVMRRHGQASMPTNSSRP